MFFVYVYAADMRQGGVIHPVLLQAMVQTYRSATVTSALVRGARGPSGRSVAPPVDWD